MNFFEYLSQSKMQIFTLFIEHIKLTVISVGFAILIGVPLGILISYIKKLNKPVLGAANVIQAIPSMALLGFAIPILGIGTLPAVVMVIIYSLLPIIKNTYTGIININPQMIESARGIGLTKLQVLTKIQIPLALPMIMAGVRISAVTAVGLLTIASFIGAGGLGFLVFSGIRTVNNYQILAGAVPACILALLIDYLAGLVEKLVTPISLQNTAVISKAQAQKNRKYQKATLSLSALVILIVFVVTSITNISTEKKTLTLAGKDYTEQHVLVSLYAKVIESKTDIKVIQKLNLGGTQVCFTALKSGDIDMYVEYSGTAYGDTLKHPPISDVQQVYDTVKSEFKEKFNIEVLDQTVFNNTYTLAVTQDTAKKYNLTTISDLSKYANQLKAGATLEFLNRNDGLLGLMDTYEFKFDKSIGIDGSSRYIAIEKKEVDIIDAFSTDGLLKKFELVTLEDDKNFFPPYYAMPIMRNEVFVKYPELVPVIDELSSVLTNEIMMELNYKVDELQMEPAKVAEDFLIENNLL